MQKRRGFASWRHLVPGTFVLSLLSLFIFSLYSSSMGFFYLIASSYLIANLLATMWETFKQFIDNNEQITGYQSLITISLLPVTFLTLHFSYGLGFLCGLFYFFNKWGDREVKNQHFDKEQFKLNANA
jgi:hypothetical protein